MKKAIITICVIVAGLMLFQLGNIYKTHFPPLSVGECLILDVGSAINSDNLVLASGKILKNDIVKGSAHIQAVVADIMEVETDVDFRDLREVGFIRTECEE